MNKRSQQELLYGVNFVPILLKVKTFFCKEKHGKNVTVNKMKLWKNFKSKKTLLFSQILFIESFQFKFLDHILLFFFFTSFIQKYKIQKRLIRKWKKENVICEMQLVKQKKIIIIICGKKGLKEHLNSKIWENTKFLITYY